MNQVFDAVDFGLILIDSLGRIERVNRWVRERSRLGAPCCGRPLAEAFSRPVDPRLLLAVRGCLDLGNSARLSQAFHPMPLPLFMPGEGCEQRLRQSVDIMALASADGPRRCLLQVRDVTDTVRREQLLKQQARRLGEELKRLTDAHQEIERQSARFREMARLAPVGLFETDLSGRLTYCNARVGEMLGAGAVQHYDKRRWTDLFAGRCADDADNAEGDRFQAWMTAASTGVRFATEFSVSHGERERTWLRVEATAIHDAAGGVHGHIFTLVDVTELHEKAKRNEQRANFDTLTGLANRDRFETTLKERLASADADDALAAQPSVMFIDLDRFKQINDSHGHHAGDLVLKAAAGRIRRCVRSGDLVARLGGDEFAVLLSERLADDVVERLARRMEKAMGLPINIGSCHVHVGASVGWATAGSDGSDVASLLHAADAAMYRVKRQRQPGAAQGSDLAPLAQPPTQLPQAA